MKHHRGELVRKTSRYEGETTFNELESDVQFDVAACIRDLDARITQEWELDHNEVWGILTKMNPTLSLVSVNPRLLAACEQRALYDYRVEDYEEIWRRGEGEDFPPVVVDTNEKEYVLCEGGHRSCSAANVGAPWIHAVDIAGFDVQPLLEEIEHPKMSGRKDWEPRPGARRPRKKRKGPAGREWTVSFYPFDSDRLQTVRGFRSRQEAERWVSGENLEDRAEDIEIMEEPVSLSGRKDWDPTEPWDALELESFLGAYIQTALWSSTVPEDDPRGGEFLDEHYDREDISPETLNQMADDSRKFLSKHWDDIKDDLSRAGHDFWLTRNHHGAGFWDGDWRPKAVGERLTKGAQEFPEVNLYAGDDGKIYH